MIRRPTRRDFLTQTALAGVAKTGRLGPVFIGARWQDVTAAAGEPWDVGATSRQRKWPRLFAYGDLELSVCECRKVTLICIQTWRDVVELPASIVGGTGAFAAAISYSDVVSALEQSGCDWQPYTVSVSDGSSTQIQKAGGNNGYVFAALPGQYTLTATYNGQTCTGSGTVSAGQQTEIDVFCKLEPVP